MVDKTAEEAIDLIDGILLIKIPIHKQRIYHENSLKTAIFNTDADFLGYNIQIRMQIQEILYFFDFIKWFKNKIMSNLYILQKTQRT